MYLVNALGMFASIISFVLFLPQAVSTWRSRRDAVALAAISPWTQGLILVNASTWWAYAHLTGEFWIGAPGFINAPLAVMTLVLILRARRDLPPAPDCYFCSTEVSHMIFSSGSVLDCTPQSRPGGMFVVGDADLERMRSSVPAA